MAGGDASGTHLWLVLMKAQRSLARHAQRSIEPHGFVLSEFAILEALLHKGPQLVSELGRRAALTSGSITSAVDRLASRGLVARASHGEDRRARVVSLTPAGRARITEIFTAHRAAMDGAAAGLSAAERRQAIALLKKLGTSADALLREAQETR